MTDIPIPSSLVASTRAAGHGERRARHPDRARFAFPFAGFRNLGWRERAGAPPHCAPARFPFGSLTTSRGIAANRLWCAASLRPGLRRYSRCEPRPPFRALDGVKRHGTEFDA